MSASTQQNAIVTSYSGDSAEMNAGQSFGITNLRPGITFVAADENPGRFAVLRFEGYQLVATNCERTDYSIDKAVINQIDILATIAAFSNTFIFESQIDIVHLRRIKGK